MVQTDILNFIGGCVQSFGSISGAYALPLSLFLAGLVAGISHCTAMCGPFVLSQTKQITRLRDAALIPYHLGRITTYTAMAALFASVLNLAFLYLPVREFVVAPILFLAATIFLVSAFPSLQKIFPWVTSIRLPSLFTDFFSGVPRGGVRLYLMGLMLGFVPCGMVVGAIMAAATAPDTAQAAFAMAMFGAGTMPALLALSFGGRSLALRYPQTMPKIKQGLMIWSSLWLFVLAGWMIF